MANTLPTTMEYFDNLLGEQLTEGGGGGGGDFTTAQVTIINGAGAERCVLIPRTSEAFLPFDPYPSISCYVSLLSNETTEITVVLYKGNCKVRSGDSGDQLNGSHVASGFVVTSGEAEIVEEGVLITGDCTITIS